MACRRWAWPALYLLCLALAHLVPAPHLACTTAERSSLLSMVSNVSSPADRPLRWPGDTADCCSWEGVTCDAQGSVVSLQLPGRGLGGTLPSALQGLGRLAELNLSRNSLGGLLPPSLLWSEHLVVLDVSFNSFSGQLRRPPPAANATQSLPPRSLNISSNLFTGGFPRLDRLPQLRELNASNNSFEGPIPSLICGSSPALRILDLSWNRFAGSIPPGLGNCSELAALDAGFNDISGQLPDDVYSASQLQHLALPYNRLTGGLNGELISRLPNLVDLDLRGNDLDGELPRGLGRLNNLRQLLLSDNRLGGGIPPELLSNCTKLRTLDLRDNNLTGDISAADFSPLSQLRTLDLGNNNFSASKFPASICSCTSLTALRLLRCSINGSVPPELRNLRSLSYLSLSLNELKGLGQALQILGQSKNLTALLLGGNFQGEAIPDGPDAESEGAFANLRVLGFGNSRLTGSIPNWIGRLRNLEVLDLSGNQLAGMIPSWIGDLPNLFYLQLSGNRLSGEIPSEMTGMKALQFDATRVPGDQSYLELPLFRLVANNTRGLRYNQVSSLPASLDLGDNLLSGTIPPGIGKLKRLRTLNLSSNHFSGEIPESLGNLSDLQIMNLSHNSLSGHIPRSLIRLTFLSTFSVAFNNLSGPVPSEGQFANFPPSSYEGNKNLCGQALPISCSATTGAGQLPPRRRRRSKGLVIAAILISGLGAAMVAVFLLLRFLGKKRGGRDKGRLRGLGVGVVDAEADSHTISTSSQCLHDASAQGTKVVVLSPGGILSKGLTMADIMEATNNFGEDNLVGCGGFGMVYRAELRDGTELAIKNLTGEAGLMVEKEFAAEVESLSAARHENLVPLWGYCVHGSVRLLVYSYMHNGSLDSWLHERDEEGWRLDWPTRLGIAQDVSRGLAHIHLACDPPIVHRDIKSSNILLDRGFRAHLADFGLARLILPYNTHVSTELVGTLGYIPPEYGNAWVATLRGDIYSFGVVLLELLTGRRAVDMLAPRESSELVSWVLGKSRLGEQDRVFDPRLRGRGFEAQMAAVLRVACLCVSHVPSRRPTIGDIVGELAGVDAIPAQPEVEEAPSTPEQQPPRLTVVTGR